MHEVEEKNPQRESITTRAKGIKNSIPNNKFIVEKKASNYQLESEPNKIHVDNVCFWYEKKGYLIGSQKAKAKKFIQLGLLRNAENGKFECLPLPGNKQTHTLEKINNLWTCTCQRFRRTGKICSHIDAIKLKLFMGKWNGNH